jgi:hypothetical protein
MDLPFFGGLADGLREGGRGMERDGMDGRGVVVQVGVEFERGGRMRGYVLEVTSSGQRGNTLCEDADIVFCPLRIVISRWTTVDRCGPLLLRVSVRWPAAIYSLAST